MYQQVSVDDKQRRATLFSALQRTLIWVLNYTLVTQVNKHLVRENHFANLMLILGMLTFAASAIESINGRFVLIGFLGVINILIYTNTNAVNGNNNNNKPA